MTLSEFREYRRPLGGDIRLASIGTHIPMTRVRNAELAARFDVAPGFLENKIGIRERALKGDSEATSDLCQRAFDDLLRRRAIDLAGVRLLCVVTQNPDRKVPHTAAILHEKLGLGKHCAT